MTYRIQRLSSDLTDLAPDTESYYRPHRSYTEHTARYIHGHYDNSSSDTASLTILQSASLSPCRKNARKHLWAGYTPSQVAITAAYNRFKPVSTLTGVEAYTRIQKTLTKTQSYRGAQNIVVSWCKHTKLPKIAWENDTNVKLKAKPACARCKHNIQQS